MHLPARLATTSQLTAPLQRLELPPHTAVPGSAARGATPLDPAVGGKDTQVSLAEGEVCVVKRFLELILHLMSAEAQSGLTPRDPLWLSLPPHGALWPASNSRGPLDLRCHYLQELDPFEIEI